MIDQAKFERFAPLAYQWAKEQEAYKSSSTALLFRTRNWPMRGKSAFRSRPECACWSSTVSRCLDDPGHRRRRAPRPDHHRCFSWRGHRLRNHHSRRQLAKPQALLLHQLVHVAQCERSGGLEAFVAEYLSEFHPQLAQTGFGRYTDTAVGRGRIVPTPSMNSHPLALF